MPQPKKKDSQNETKLISKPKMPIKPKLFFEKLDLRASILALITFLGIFFCSLGIYHTLISKHSDQSKFGFLLNKEVSYRIQEKNDSIQQVTLRLNEQQIEVINQELATLKNRIYNRKNPSDTSIGELKNSITGLERRLTSLERVILDSPEKALSMPLLRHELDNIKTSYNTRLDMISDALLRDVDHLYNIFLTVTITLGLSFLGAIFTLSAGRKETT